MTSNERLFLMVEIAESAYANLSNAVSDKENLIISVQKDHEEDKTLLSTPQATDLANHWEVAAHQPDTDSGFSATLFRSLENGEYVLACRGIAGGSDISTELGDIYRQEFTQREFDGNQFVRN